MGTVAHNSVHYIRYFKHLLPVGTHSHLSRFPFMWFTFPLSLRTQLPSDTPCEPTNTQAAATTTRL